MNRSWKQDLVIYPDTDITLLSISYANVNSKQIQSNWSKTKHQNWTNAAKKVKVHLRIFKKKTIQLMQKYC